MMIRHTPQIQLTMTYLVQYVKTACDQVVKLGLILFLQKKRKKKNLSGFDFCRRYF